MSSPRHSNVPNPNALNESAFQNELAEVQAKMAAMRVGKMTRNQHQRCEQTMQPNL